MYATSQRVVSPTTGFEGINSFLYAHDGLTWDGPPPSEIRPETNPGELLRSSISVAPPGNRVRSFLDLIAPDGSSVADVTAVFDAIMSREAPESFPTTWTEQRCWVKLSLERALLPVWRQEFNLLRESLLLIVKGSQGS